MEFPEIITRLPEAAIPFPSSVVETSVLQSGRLSWRPPSFKGQAGDVCLWHLTDMLTALSDVRGRSGKHLLAARISPVDPKRTFVARLAAYLGLWKGLILIGYLGQTLGEQ
jgi:hypothetical protein